MKERGQELPPILFESVVELAKETTLRSGGHIPTLVIDALPHPIILQIPQLAPTHELRLEQMFIAGTALAEQATISRLRQVIWVCEGWMSETEAGKLPEVPPSRDPKRREVLVITGYKASTRRTQTAIWEMVRDETGVLRELRDFGYGRGDEEEGDSPLLNAFLDGLYKAWP